MVHNGIVQFCVAFIIALIVGSLVEYAAHRWMHEGKVLKVRHAKHHRNLEGQGWFGEFKDYATPGLAIIWVGFLFSVPAGIGFAIGALGYAAFAAYAHQVQHERPELVFWLPQPVHYLHHRENMWRHNFGISQDIWDRVFATYKPVEWQPEQRARDYPLRSYIDITWI